MSGLSTHVLDVSRGRPAAGVAVTLLLDGSEIGAQVTDEDGRATFGEVAEGVYELRFAVGDYFGSDEFLDVVPVRFRVTAGSRYHVPLLVSPWSYSTYRGS